MFFTFLQWPTLDSEHNAPTAKYIPFVIFPDAHIYGTGTKSQGHKGLQEGGTFTPCVPFNLCIPKCIFGSGVRQLFCANNSRRKISNM